MEITMINYENETIAAIATALSDSGIGIVRISGEKAIYIIDSIFRSASGKKILLPQSPHGKRPLPPSVPESSLQYNHLTRPGQTAAQRNISGFFLPQSLRPSS